MKPIKDPFPPTPERFHLRLEQTLYKLEEREMTKKKFPAGMAVALAVLLITATAFASAVVGGTVDWNGNYTPDEEQIATTPPDDAVDLPPSRAELAMENISEGEVWQILKSRGTRMLSPSPYLLNDLERFEKYLYGTSLPMFIAPEDMSSECMALYTPTEDTPYEEIFFDDEVLQKFKMQPLFAGSATSYEVTFTDKNGGRIFIRCENAELDRENTSFGVDGKDAYEILKGTGWDHGIYIVLPDGDQFVTLQFVWPDFLTEFYIRADGPISKETVLSLIPAPY